MTSCTSTRWATRAVRIAGALVVAAAGLRSVPAASAQSLRLESGKPVTRDIRKGETHVYQVAVPRDRFVNGVVEQRDIDLVVRVVDPTGATAATVDSPNGSDGPEPWSLDGKRAGTWRLEITPLADAGAAGRYEVRIDETITSDEHAERIAKRRYRSPQLLELWRNRRAPGAIARFSRQLEGRAPLVEPIAGDPRGDVLITIVHRAPPRTRYVAVFGGPFKGAANTALAQFEDSDLWFVTARAPRDSRFTYRLYAGDPLGGTSSLEAWSAAFRRSILDPWNPRQFERASLLELPDAPPQPFLQRGAGVPAGRIVQAALRSRILDEERKLGVYLPPGFVAGRGRYPYIVVFDGLTYGISADALVPTPAILDNLIAQNKLPPTLAVFVDAQSTRGRDLPMSAPFAEFLAKELAPWMQREYSAASDPAQVTLAGSSFGGLAAVYGAFHHPGVFGNALSQSGSFWFSPGALGAPSRYHVESGAMMREIIAAPPRPVRIWMEVGLFEEGNGMVAGGDQVAQNRHLRDVLLAKGYRVTYHEYSGGHDYACWRGSLADGLIALRQP
jgi:enterochelin esterase-like enzyme